MIRLDWRLHWQRPAGRWARRERAVEHLIGLYADCDDDRALDVIRDVIRPDLTAAELLERVAELCDLAAVVGECEMSRGRVDAYSAARDDYAVALTRLVTAPADDPMALIDTLSQPADELAARRGGVR